MDVTYPKVRILFLWEGSRTVVRRGLRCPKTRELSSSFQFTLQYASFRACRVVAAATEHCLSFPSEDQLAGKPPLALAAAAAEARVGGNQG
jgi:hypothetical protein